MNVPAWTLALPLGAVIALFLLAGIAVGWWVAGAIFIPAFVFVSVAAVVGRGRFAKPGS